MLEVIILADKEVDHMTQAKVPIGLSIEQWNAIMDGLGSHPSTVNDYRKIINLLHSYKNGKFHIISMTNDDAREYFKMLDDKVKEGILTKNTVHRYQATLRSIGSRIENHPETFPGYQNPFSGILHNEVRACTKYTESTFARAGDIRKMIGVLPGFPQDKQLLMEMMLYLGLRPKQVENIRLSDFTVNPNSPDKELILTIPDGKYLEKINRKDKPLQENAFTKLMSTSHNGNRLWDVQGVFRFYAPFSSKLKTRDPDLGKTTNDAFYFETSQHRPYSYRALHHFVQEVCVKAGLDCNAVTPYQLSLFGSINSYLLFSTLCDEQQLRKRLPKAKSREEHNRILGELHEVNARFLPLANNGWIGCWVLEYPLTRKKIINDIKAQLGRDFLLKAVGVDK